MRTILSGNPVGEGPQGADPVPAEYTEITDADVETLRRGEYTVAIVFHYLQTDYVQLQRMGLEERFEELNIEIHGVYGPNFDVSKQIEILNSLAEKDIDALVSIPIDEVATAKSYQNIVASETNIVFIDNVPRGFEHPADYVGTVSSDNKGLGIYAGRVLCDLIGSGKIGIIKFDAPFYGTSARESGAREMIETVDGIDIVAEAGFTDPDDVYQLTQDLLATHPDISGMFVSWGDPPGKHAVAAAQDLGRDDIVMTTTGLSMETAKTIAKDGLIKATGAQFPYQQGYIEANMVGNSLLANETPQYVASGVLPINRSNLLELFPTYFQEDPPAKIANYYE